MNRQPPRRHRCLLERLRERAAPRELPLGLAHPSRCRQAVLVRRARGLEAVEGSGRGAKSAGEKRVDSVGQVWLPGSLQGLLQQVLRCCRWHCRLERRALPGAAPRRGALREGVRKNCWDRPLQDRWALHWWTQPPPMQHLHHLAPVTLGETLPGGSWGTWWGPMAQGQWRQAESQPGWRVGVGLKRRRVGGCR